MMRLVLIILTILVANPAHAILSIDITKGNVDPLPIALPNLGTIDDELTPVGKDILRVVAADLKRSGVFKPINKNAYTQKIISSNTLPTFPSWRQINTAALLTGGLMPKNSAGFEMEFRLWDVYAEKQIAGGAYTTTHKNWRRISHIVADEIYKRITGEDGYFDTRIVYIAESGPATKRIKRLAIMDQDGANNIYLTDGKDLVLTPRFSPAMQEITYMSYANNTPRVYLRNIENGRERVLGDFPGISFAPRFAPDGKSVIMSASLSGNSEIYSYDLKRNRKKRLTKNPAIDTSPSYSPDGEFITFNSDRGGSQQIYVMDKNGKNIRRITFGKGTYGTPVWSPRGDLIAFTRMHNGKFYIGVIKPDGKGERLLTESYLVEGPTWSPNGRVIIYTKGASSTNLRAGTSKLYSIDLTGYNEREVITPTDASDPAWSPLLQ